MVSDIYNRVIFSMYSCSKPIELYVVHVALEHALGHHVQQFAKVRQLFACEH
ncbi:hypothetical protein SAMD00019534_041060 [Acytostelium subglobosum LB1]|uniref:hypothetical protein n=1 Tax=Acytostelium subglobosum LB1 TaxID=1410327 RepID=UPI000645160C|nr:hypothetical protein SAMD00019534_041060 [Acytostelium subglobosum LB1]GAM20931.1 hypothetical protein SAMD00019534_041060 [Acytostelium subglobosum LB1]|eukprot:XP_012756065.1 hypothetical protein SAMD00019534_041060 [Acytostelium subglobosum LB1]